MSANTQNPLAGKPAPASLLVNVSRLVTAYYAERPHPSVPEQRVVFGTSGHRGSSLTASFNDAHIAAITEAICRHRKQQGTDGPLFLGWDTHALSEPARVTALEVLAAHGVEVMRDARNSFTPTPVVSQAIVAYNRGRTRGLADGIVVTPSHNPPEYGGIKYDPPSGGPAGTGVTGRIADMANELLADGLRGVARVSWSRARQAGAQVVVACSTEVERTQHARTLLAAPTAPGVRFRPRAAARTAGWRATVRSYRPLPPPSTT